MTKLKNIKNGELVRQHIYLGLKKNLVFHVIQHFINYKSKITEKETYH